MIRFYIYVKFPIIGCMWVNLLMKLESINMWFLEGYWNEQLATAPLFRQNNCRIVQHSQWQTDRPFWVFLQEEHRRHKANILQKLINLIIQFKGVFGNLCGQTLAGRTRQIVHLWSKSCWGPNTPRTCSAWNRISAWLVRIIIVV